MIVCADDFGLREDIDSAILDLCALRRLSAVSCLVLFERCSRNLVSKLDPFRGQIDLGLHLCFTDEGLPLSLEAGTDPMFFRSFASSLRRKVSARDIRSQIAAQYELFLEKCGAEPDYIDGHLHIHQSPVIRKALIEFVLALPARQRPYVRNTYLPIHTLKIEGLPWSKAWLIGRFGKAMAKHLRAAGIRTNQGFAGIYNFARVREFAKYLPRFIRCLEKPTGILVVHPGHRELWRKQELEALRDFKLALALNRFEPES